MKHVETYLGLNVQLITKDAAPLVIPVHVNDTLGSLDGDQYIQTEVVLCLQKEAEE